MRFVGTGPLQAAERLEARVGHARDGRGESERSSFHTSSADGWPQSCPMRSRELAHDPQLVARVAGRVHGLAHALHAALAVGDGALAFRPRRRRGKHDVRELRRLREKDLLHHEMIELLEQVRDVRARRRRTAPGSRR